MSLFNTALSGIKAADRGINTTGNNIANANTPGYSRQRVDFVNREPQGFGFGFVGRGVTINGIERLHDSFVAQQLQEVTAEQNRLDNLFELSASLDNLLADDSSGLRTAIEGFFQSLQQVSNDPAGAPGRQLLLSDAQGLIDRYQFLDGQMEAQNTSINNRLTDLTEQVNATAQTIAQLNENITVATAQANGNPPNDLLDQRDEQIRTLSELTSLTTTEQDDGAINVFIGNGQTLVSGGQALRLNAIESESNFRELAIAYETDSGTIDISSAFSGGEIGGLLDFRREVLNPSRADLGRNAIVLANTFNAQHNEGIDLQSQLGQDFFREPTGTVVSFRGNIGSGDASISYNDVTQLTISDYQLQFDGTNYQLSNSTTGQTVSASVVDSASGALSLDGFTVTPSGTAAAGDRFLIRPAAGAASNIQLDIQNINQIAAASAIQTSVPTTNIGDANIQLNTITDTTQPGFANQYSLVFSDASTYDVIDETNSTTVSTGNTYTSGATIALPGYSVQLTGNPVAGDRFQAQFNNEGIADNRNSLALGELQVTGFIDGVASYGESYGNLVSRVGTQTRQAEINRTAQTRLVAEVTERRESLSGVNLDEEAVNLARFQQAYEASAQVIAVADRLFDTILSAVGR